MAICGTPAAAFAEEVRVESETCAIVADGIPRAILDEALRTADAAWPIVRSTLRLPETTKLDRPLVVHLLATIAEYEAKDAELSKGRFKANLAFSSPDTGESYLALQPPLSPEALERVGLMYLTRQQVAHELTHIATYRFVKCFRQMPTWLHEGLACYVANETMRALEIVPKDGTDPEWSSFAWRAKSMLEAKTFPSALHIIKDAKFGNDYLDVYAGHQLLFSYLAEAPRAKKLGAFLREILELEGTQSDGDRILQKARDLVSSSGFDKGFQRWIEERPTPFHTVFRSLEVRKDDWYLATFTKNAITWVTERCENKPFRWTGSVEFLPGSSHQVNLLVGRIGEDWLQVCLSPDSGITVFHLHADATKPTRPMSTSTGGKTDETKKEAADDAPDPWDRLKNVRTDALEMGTSTSFAILYDGKELHVEIAGERLLSQDLAGRSMAGNRGVGALAGSVAILRDLKFEILKNTPKR